MNDQQQETPPTTQKVWLDADPSGFVWTGLDCDDDLAVLSALALHNNPKQSNFHLEGISICGGNAPLKHTWPDIHALLKHVDGSSSSWKPHKGYGWQSMQVSRTWLKWLDYLQPDIPDSTEASKAIIHQSHKTKNLVVLTLGPPTNLAKALEQDASLASRIGHVFMMGGELTNQRLDLNFASDRAAARTVVEANVPTTIIPIQLCAQVVMDDAFVESLARDCCCKKESTKDDTQLSIPPVAAVCALLPKMRQQVYAMPKFINPAVAHRFPKQGRWIPSPNLHQGFIPWDIVAVLAISHPELFDHWEYHIARFPTCEDFSLGEPCNGTMLIQDIHATADMDTHSGIVRIPHLLRNETTTLRIMKDLLCQIPAQGPPPRMMLGFLAPLGGVLIATLLFLLCIMMHFFLKPWI